MKSYYINNTGIFTINIKFFDKKDGQQIYPQYGITKSNEAKYKHSYFQVDFDSLKYCEGHINVTETSNLKDVIFFGKTSAPFLDPFKTCIFFYFLTWFLITYIGCILVTI